MNKSHKQTTPKKSSSILAKAGKIIGAVAVLVGLAMYGKYLLNPETFIKKARQQGRIKQSVTVAYNLVKKKMNADPKFKKYINKKYGSIRGVPLA